MFEHSCTNSSASLCVMRHFWSGGSWPGYQYTRLRYYVDGGKTFPMPLVKRLISALLRSTLFILVLDLWTRLPALTLGGALQRRRRL